MVDLKKLNKKRDITLKKIVATGMDFFLNHHISTTGKGMSFEDMPYLKAIYLDQSPEIAVTSSVQTGKSECALIKGMAGVKTGLNVFHVFSTGEAKNSFVKSRINELCDRVPVYKKMEHDDRRNMYLRNMGNANWKFVISNSKTHFDEFPADMAIVDEYDSCNADNLKLIDTRMENSDFKFKFYVGNPSVTNFGISALYEKSTQNEWFYKCKHCEKWFPADFFKIVVNEVLDKDGNHVSFLLYDKEWEENCGRDIKIRCNHCEALQSRPVGDDVAKWIPKNPDARITGYHISKLMKLSSPIYELWLECKDAEGNDYKMQVFYNKKLGLPFTGVGAKVTAEMLDRITYNYTVKDASHRPTIAGMDVGSKFDMEISISAKHDGKRKRLFLNAFRLKSLDEVKEKIEMFNVKTLCVGIKPERHLMQNFREEMFGICEVVLIEELEGRSGNLKLIGFQEKEEEGVINVDRTWMLDESMRNIKMKIDIVPKGFRGILGGYWLRSMESITRIYENQKEEYKWSKADNDHFRFAGAFCMLAWMKTQEAVMMGDDFTKTEYSEKERGILEKQGKQTGEIGLFRERFRGFNRQRKGFRILRNR